MNSPGLNQWLTGLVDDGQGGDPALHKEAEGFDDGRVGVDEGDVTVGAYAQLPQGLLHEGRLWHLTHLRRDKGRMPLNHYTLYFTDTVIVFLYKTDST